MFKMRSSSGIPNVGFVCFVIRYLFKEEISHDVWNPLELVDRCLYSCQNVFECWLVAIVER